MPVLKRIVYTEVEAYVHGPAKEILPDLDIKKATVDEGGQLVELNPEDITALVFMTEEGAIVFVLDPMSKQNLLKTLTGGLQIAGAGELQKLGGM